MWIRLKPYENMQNQESSSSQYRSKSCQTQHSPFLKPPNQQREVFKKDHKCISVSEGRLVIREDDGSDRCFPFPNILREEMDNDSIYEDIVRRKVDTALRTGTSFTVLTYGISGSGKSHTILGNSSKNRPERGIIHNTIRHIYEEYGSQVKMETTMLQIYNEKVYDLLNSEMRVLGVADGSDGVVISDLASVAVGDYRSFGAVLDKCMLRRIVGSNMNNQVSSRSHMIIEVSVYLEGRKRCRLRFVDLAGSEKVGSVQQAYIDERDLLKEGSSINKSLLSLTNCINILSDDKKRYSTFIPYRNSKLTRILKDSLSRLP